MAGRKYDIALAGGGLSGGLIALALHRLRPDLSIVLVEQAETLGGGRGWTWFASDLSPTDADLLAGFRLTCWDEGYDVRFPGYQRRLTTPCRSLAAADFDAALRRDLPEDSVRTRAAIARLDARCITLASGEEIVARAVIDCRGFQPSPHLVGGWRQSMGRHLRTPEPHGLARPVLIDAAVEQQGMLRYVRILPLGAHELYVEDTCHGTDAELDRRAHSSHIDAYCRKHGWQGDIVGSEAGMLPLVTGGNFAKFQQEHVIEGVAVAGTRAGLFHPLTGSALPLAVRTALAIAEEADLTGPQLAALLQARAQDHWRASRLHRSLGARLLDPGQHGQRHRLFEALYRLPRGLVERLHAGQSTWGDRVRMHWRLPAGSSKRTMPARLAPVAPMAQRQKL
jgi:lycopene beta-cyclase